MTEVALTIALVAVGCAAIKATGPALVRDRPLPSWAPRVITLLVPALLASLVVAGTVAEDRALVLDARAPGVVAGALALRMRVPLVMALVIAAAVTAFVRTL